MSAAFVIGLAAGPVSAQEAIFKSGLNPTNLGAVPVIGGVQADAFEWALDGGKAEITALGDLEVRAEGLLIADTGDADPTPEGTTGDASFFASLVCGETVVASTAPIPSVDGNFSIEEPDFLLANDVSECEGAVILVRTVSDAELEMYGAAGAGLNPFRIFIVDQDTAEVSPVGEQAITQHGLTGIAFDATGQLFATTNRISNVTVNPDGSVVIERNKIPELQRIDPDTGEETKIADLETAIRDLAVQPGTNELFGTARFFSRDGLSFSSGTLVRIDKTTGALTVVGDNGIFGAGLAFDPADGTLYRTGFEDLGGTDPFGRADANRTLDVLDPETGAILSSIETVDPFFDNGDGTFGRDVFLDGLGVRPGDGTIFGTAGGSRRVYTVDPSTGILSLVGFASGPPFIEGGPNLSDLAFRGGVSPWVAASGF